MRCPLLLSRDDGWRWWTKERKVFTKGNSIMTKRYGMLPYRKQDGSFEFTLE